VWDDIIYARILEKLQKFRKVNACKVVEIERGIKIKQPDNEKEETR